MRKFKFRAWDNRLKKMVEPEYITSNGEICEFVSDYENYMDKVKDCILMQFTGLQDKNGREIYEGDIVKYPDCYCCFTSCGIEYGETTSIGVIEWDKEQAQFYVTNRETVDLEVFWEEIEKTEVIGNIYENPDLLEVER